MSTLESVALERTSPRAAATEWRKGRRSPLWFDSLVIAAGVISVVLAHVMSLGYAKLANMDEAYAAALAERLLEGQRLYEGAVSQRGPLMYYSFEALARLFGWDNIVAIRCAALGLAFAHLAVAYWAARVILSRRAATLVFAVVAYALAFGFDPYDGLALHGETLLTPMAIAGTTLGALALGAQAGTRRRAIAFVLAGICFGAATCVKQTAALLPLPLILWWMVDVRRTGAARAAILKDALSLAGALAILPVVFVVHAWSDGTLRSLVYYCFTYNVSVHANPTPDPLFKLKFLSDKTSGTPLFFLANAAAFGFVGRTWWRRARRVATTKMRSELLRGFGAREYIGLQYVVAFVSAAAPPQMFQHYFIPVIAYLALTLAAYTEKIVRGIRGMAMLRAGLLACLALWIVVAAQTAYVREKADGNVLHGRALESASRYVQSITGPEDRIFVWGFSPWMYLYAHRRPAGRFVFSTYTTGFVPWFWAELDLEARRVVPGSMEALLGDLDREKPAVVVDAGSVEMGRSMRAYPRASEWLHAHYCFDARVGAFDVYRRKVEGRACRTDYFPIAAPPVDWRDAPLPIPVPMTVDHPESRPLPPGDFFAPVRFDTRTRVCRDWALPWWQSLPDARTCNFGIHVDEDDPHLPMRDPEPICAEGDRGGE